eukprot:PhF_6_TR39092/c0_g1_i1/m.58505
MLSVHPNVTRVTWIQVPYLRPDQHDKEDFNIIYVPGVFVGLKRVLVELKVIHIRAIVVFCSWGDDYLSYPDALRILQQAHKVIDVLITSELDIMKFGSDMIENVPIVRQLPPYATSEKCIDQSVRCKVGILGGIRSDSMVTEAELQVEYPKLSVLSTRDVRHVCDVVVFGDMIRKHLGAVVDVLSCGAVLVPFHSTQDHHFLRHWFPELQFPQSRADFFEVVGSLVKDEGDVRSSMVREIRSELLDGGVDGNRGILRSMKTAVDDLVVMYLTL